MFQNFLSTKYGKIIFLSTLGLLTFGISLFTFSIFEKPQKQETQSKQESIETLAPTPELETYTKIDLSNLGVESEIEKKIQEAFHNLGKLNAVTYKRYGCDGDEVCKTNLISSDLVNGKSINYYSQSVAIEGCKMYKETSYNGKVLRTTIKGDAKETGTSKINKETFSNDLGKFFTSGLNQIKTFSTKKSEEKINNTQVTKYTFTGKSQGSANETVSIALDGNGNIVEIAVPFVYSQDKITILSDKVIDNFDEEFVSSTINKRLVTEDIYSKFNNAFTTLRNKDVILITSDLSETINNKTLYNLNVLQNISKKSTVITAKNYSNNSETYEYSGINYFDNLLIIQDYLNSILEGKFDKNIIGKVTVKKVESDTIYNNKKAKKIELFYDTKVGDISFCAELNKANLYSEFHTIQGIFAENGDLLSLEIQNPYTSDSIIKNTNPPELITFNFKTGDEISTTLSAPIQ